MEGNGLAARMVGRFGSIPGVEIEMAGRKYIVPPLTLGQLRRLMPKVQEMKQISVDMQDEQISALISVVTAALQRNYPELTEELVEEMLDLGNAREVFEAVLSVSGVRRAVPGEAEAERIGPPFTGSSPPPADTGLETSTS